MGSAWTPPIVIDDRGVCGYYSKMVEFNGQPAIVYSRLSPKGISFNAYGFAPFDDHPIQQVTGLRYARRR